MQTPTTTKINGLARPTQCQCLFKRYQAVHMPAAQLPTPVEIVLPVLLVGLRQFSQQRGSALRGTLWPVTYHMHRRPCGKIDGPGLYFLSKPTKKDTYDHVLCLRRLFQGSHIEGWKFRPQVGEAVDLARRKHRFRLRLKSTPGAPGCQPHMAGV